MLNRPTYELLPYLYLGIGYGFITYSPNASTSIGGGFLFILGAIILNLRSNYRRKDKEFNRKNTKKRPFFYNLKPFIIFLIGVFCMTWVDQKAVHFFAAVLCLTAVWILFLRLSNRHFVNRAVTKVYR